MISRVKKWKKTNIAFAIFLAISFGLPMISDAKLRSESTAYLFPITMIIFYVIVIIIIDFLINIKKEAKEAKVKIMSAAEDAKNFKKNFKEDYKNKMEEMNKKEDMKKTGIKKADQEKIKKDADDLDLEL